MEDIEVDVNETETVEKDETETPQSNEIINTSDNAKENSPKHKLVRLPLARVKAIMKKDPGCTLLGQDAVFLVTKSTEMFIEFISKELAKQTIAAKRKTASKKELDTAIKSCPQLCFLDGALE